MGGFFSRLFGRTKGDVGFSLEWDGLTCRPSGGSRKVQAWEEVEPILRGLEGADGFVILSFMPERYIQASAATDGLVLEYREGSGDAHYACVDPITVDRACVLFKAYYEDPATINQQGRWHRVVI